MVIYNHNIEYDRENITYIRKKGTFSNEIFTLDIETTSLFNINGKWQTFDFSISKEDYLDIEKAAVPYVWQFGVNDTVYYGRDFNDLINVLKEISEKDITKIIYIFNLSFEFQFLLNIFDKYSISDMCCRDVRKPIQFKVKELNIIFRCAYMLTNMSLEVAAAEYTDVAKKSGDLDYLKCRSPLTNLSDTELSYCEYDIICLYKIIKYFSDKYGCLQKVPLTSTGRVRRELKKVLDYWYFKKMWHLIPTSPVAYCRLMDCFSGGYTHANYINSNRFFYERIYSYDIASSYPFVMCTEKYPCSHFIKSNVNSYLKQRESHAFILHVRFLNLKPKYSNHYLQNSKVYNKINPIIDNGRIYSMDSGDGWFTDVDLDIISINYDFDIEYIEIYKARKNYLDIRIIKFILDLYKDKTTLKGLNDLHSEEVYRTKKAMLNSLYGCSITSPLNNTADFKDGSWFDEDFSLDLINRKLKEMNGSYSTLFYYGAGVFITAYARKNLMLRIFSSHEFDNDVIYCDTDSIKFRDNKHCKLFDDYNKSVVEEKYKEVIEYFEGEISIEDFKPKDKKGLVHPLGYFELDAEYYDPSGNGSFITLGAKKYCYFSESDNKLHITVAGVSKSGAAALNGDMRNFKKEFEWDYYNSGKLTHTYIDNQQSFVYEDYEGNFYKSDFKYGICLQPTTYKLGLTAEYEMLLKEIHRRGLIKKCLKKN